MANVDHFMAELAADEGAWPRRRGKMPVIVDDEGNVRRRALEAESAERHA